jgi:hypothetical protein
MFPEVKVSKQTHDPDLWPGVHPSARVEERSPFEWNAHRVPRPHIPVAAFADAGRYSPNTGDCDPVSEDFDYDDSAIIVIEDDSDEPVTPDDISEPSASWDSAMLSIEVGQASQRCPDAHAWHCVAETTIVVVLAETAHCVTQETADGTGEVGFSPVVIQSDETDELTEVEGRISIGRRSTFNVGEAVAASPIHGSSITTRRDLPIRGCYRKAASEIERLIKAKEAKRTLIAISGQDSSGQRDKYSASEFSAAFAFPLAIALAQNRRLLLVDLVSNATCDEVGLDAGPGVSGLVSGICTPDEAVRPTPSPQVDLLPHGDTDCRPNSGLSLDSIRLSTAMSSLSREYDLVLIIAAADAVTGRSRFSETIEIALLAAPLSAVTMEAIAEDCARLKSIGLHPAGVLMLDCSPSVLNTLKD